MTAIQMLTTAYGEPLPFRVEITDVESLESTVRTFRSLDYRYGGDSCRTALDAVGSWTILLRKGNVPARLARRLSRALGDLYNLLAWTEFDTGRGEHARRHFAIAAELAAEAGDDDLAANVCYRLGRLYLHHRDPDRALTEFGRGQLLAARAGARHAQAILCANQAWAHAMRGEARPALADLGRASDALAAATGSPPPWAKFFDANDLAAMSGTVHVELARAAGRDHAGPAIGFLTEAVAGYGPEMARSSALTQILLALAHALDHDLPEAARIGTAAIEAARNVRSVRTKDRLSPLEAALGADPNPDGRQLLERIRAFRSEPVGP